MGKTLSPAEEFLDVWCGELCLEKHREFEQGTWGRDIEKENLKTQSGTRSPRASAKLASVRLRNFNRAWTCPDLQLSMQQMEWKELVGSLGDSR